MQAVEVKVSDDTYKRQKRKMLRAFVPGLVVNAVIAQVLFGKEVSSTYPSLFVAVLVMGVFMTIPIIAAQATVLQWSNKAESVEGENDLSLDPTVIWNV